MPGPDDSVWTSLLVLRVIVFVNFTEKLKEKKLVKKIVALLKRVSLPFLQFRIHNFTDIQKQYTN